MKPRKPVSRLTKPSILRQVDRGLLRRLLGKFTAFFKERDIELPPETKKRGDYDFNKLSKALLSDEGRPDELLLALEAVGTMADVHGAEILQRTLIQEPGEVAPDKKAVAADLALRAYLDASEAFNSALLEKQVVDTRSYRCFVPALDIQIEKADFSAQRLACMERELSEFFDTPDRGGEVKPDHGGEMKPNRGCEIVPSGEGGPVRWFIIIHGGRRRREPTFENGQRKHVEFHPETDDVVRINSVSGEMWIHAKTKREREVYRRTFGKHLLQDEEAFIPAGKLFSLEPLRAPGEASLKTQHIEGCAIESIELRQLEILLDSANQTVWKMSSKNSIFKSLHRVGGIPAVGTIRAATFLVKYHGSNKQTQVKVRLPADADYERDSDSEWIEVWLKNRKFWIEPPGRNELNIKNVILVADPH